MEATSAPQQPPPPATPPPEETILAALTLLLLSVLPAQVFAAQALGILTAFGLPKASSQAAIQLTLRPLPTFGEGRAERFYARTASPRRAAFILQSARRLSSELRDLGPAIAKERTYFAQHLDAERARQESAARVDQAAEQHGPVLGWRSVLDERTTPECRAAHAHNFNAARPPAIGYPGSLHGGACRCVAGPPWAQGKMLA